MGAAVAGAAMGAADRAVAARGPSDGEDAPARRARHLLRRRADGVRDLAHRSPLRSGGPRGLGCGGAPGPRKVTEAPPRKGWQPRARDGAKTLFSLLARCRRVMEEYPMRREGTPASGLKRTPASLSSGAARSSSSSIAEGCSSRIHSAPAAPRRALGTGEARGAGAAPRTHPARAGRGRRASAAPRRGPLSPGGGAGSHPSPV
jgi:hypothetical protein